jgi:tRNA dimethylallyltransferase
VRVSRALEVFEVTGRPLSAFQAEHGFRRARYPARLLQVARERSDLDQRIRSRTREMFDAGWVGEVHRLLERGFGGCRAMRSVGYRQIASALQAESKMDENELELAVYRATRVFARRQRTWLREQAVTPVAPILLGKPLSRPHLLEVLGLRQ